MTPDDARAALAAAGIDADDVVALGDGWASWTFELDGRSDRAVPARRERWRAVTNGSARSCPRSRSTSRSRCPSLEWPGEWDGLPFHVYEKLPGAALTEDTLDFAAVGRMLRELHSFPAERRAGAARRRGHGRRVAQRLRGALARHRRRVVPRLSVAVRGAVTREFADFIRDVSFEPALVHRDLGPEHILVGDCLAMIDFEDVAIGDPVIDFVGIFNAFGFDRGARGDRAVRAARPRLQRPPALLPVDGLGARGARTRSTPATPTLLAGRAANSCRLRLAVRPRRARPWCAAIGS